MLTRTVERSQTKIIDTGMTLKRSNEDEQENKLPSISIKFNQRSFLPALAAGTDGGAALVAAWRIPRF
ncbi:hypothetical protein O9929_13700 [Vibrio lentus]|nr:hypothetical protein [Vibrio lentus]